MRTFCSAVILGGLALLAGTTTAPDAEAAACTEIHTVAEFQDIARNPSGSYCLAQDLDAAGVSGFLPIPSFQGKLDGRGFAIRNLTVVSDSPLVGIFGEIDFASVRNLKILNLTVISTRPGATVAGLTRTNYGLIENVSLTGKVVGPPKFCDATSCYYSRVAGLVVWNFGTITRTSVSVIVGKADGELGSFGGLAETNQGTISWSHASGLILGEPLDTGLAPQRMIGTATNRQRRTTAEGTGSFAGGLVDLNVGEVRDSYSTVAVRNVAEAGGLVSQNLGKIIRSSASGPVSGSDVCGGLVAKNVINTDPPLVRRSYASGAVTCQSGVAGGLVGMLEGRVEESYSSGKALAGGGLIGTKDPNAQVVGSYWDRDASGQAASAGGRSLATAVFKSALPPGFDPAKWAITPAVSYPYLIGHGWLKFPIQDTTAYDVALATAADRSGSPLDPDPSTRLEVFHKKDGVVLAYTGEKGESSFGRRCRGYRNAENAAFAINGHYVGQDCGAGPNPAYLSYDGSPGYEFAIPKLTPIYAPAAGELFKASIDPINPSKACPGLTAWDAAHTFYIDHGNGYSSWFLKADALDPSIEAQIASDYSKSAHVNAGDRIAFSGSFGHCGTPDSLPSGLAFEMRQGLTDVVDPYAEGFWIEP